MTQFTLAFQHIKAMPRTFWIVLITTLINQMGNMAFVFLIIYLTQSLNFTVTQASIALALFSGCAMVSSLVGGSLADKVGPPRLLIAVLSINSIVLFTFPMANTHTGVLIHCLIWGSVYGLYRPASQTFVATLSTPGMHKVTFSIYRLIINLGMSIGPAVGGYLAGFSYSLIFIANGLANLFAAIFLFLGLKKTHWLSFRAGKRVPIEFGFKWLRKDERLLIFALALIPTSMVFYQHQSTLSVYLHNDLGLSLKFYSLLFTINTLLIVFLELPLNIATIKWSYRTNFMLGSFLMAIGFGGFGFATTKTHIVLLTILWTFGEMILYPASNSFIADIAPENRRGTYMSIYTSCNNLALLFGPITGAYILEKMGGLNLWINCAIWGLLSMFMFNFVNAQKDSEPVLAAESEST